MSILFIHYYIDKERSPNGQDETITIPLICAKYFKEVYVYQGIKKTKNFRDGKVCQILKDGSNIIIDGDPNNKYQTPGDHSKWDYPNPKSKFSQILLNCDIISILGSTVGSDMFQPELNNTKAFVVQQPIYCPILKITRHVIKNDEIMRVNSNEFIEMTKKYRNINKKNNMNIGFVGTICGRKGQLNFLQKIDIKNLKNYTLHFIGTIAEQDYLNKIKLFLKENKINHIIHGKLNGEDYIKKLCDLKCIVNYSKLDANPRVIWDALYCGIPFFASTKCEIPKIIHNFGIIDNNANSFFKLLKFDKHKEILDFADENLEPEKYIRKLYLDVIQCHQ